MKIQGFSSQLNSLSRGIQAGPPPGPQPLGAGQGSAPGKGFSTVDTFEGASGRRGTDPATALRNSLHNAGVDQSTSMGVLDAVRGGASLDSALQDAGLSPQQHQSVMASVLAQDPSRGGGSGSGSQIDPGTAIRNSLHNAGVDQSTSKGIMDAVRDGASLDSALQEAGLSPQQHQSVMASVLAQDPARGSGS